MPLTTVQILMMIGAIALGTMITRFLPFILFPENKKTPEFVMYLGTVLPAAMMGLLVVYCLRNVAFLSGNFAIPEFLSILSIIVLHMWKNNVLLSIGGGTAVYMLMIQFIF